MSSKIQKHSVVELSVVSDDGVADICVVVDGDVAFGVLGSGVVVGGVG